MRKLFAIATIAVLLPSVALADARTDGVDRAAAWLVSQQQDNGAFFRTDQPARETAGVVGALVAADADGRSVDDALDRIASSGPRDATRGAYTGRIIAGIVAGGGDPTDHGGYDYVAKLRSQYDDGTYDAKFFGHLEAVNGLLAAKATPPAKAIDLIRDSACGGGGFGDDRTCPNGPNVDSTAWAMSVLIAAGRKSDSAVTGARSYLLSAQHPDGGFAFTEDLPTSADSTGLALSAIAALGENARAAPWRDSDGDDPVAALLRLQSSGGAFRFVSESKPNARSTVNALPGLAGAAYPVRPRPAPPPADEDDPQPVASRTPERTRRPDRRPATVALPGSTTAPTLVPSPGGSSPFPSLLRPSAEAAPPFAGSTSDRRSSGALGVVAAWAALISGVAGAGFGVHRWRLRSRR